MSHVPFIAKMIQETAPRQLERIRADDVGAGFDVVFMELAYGIRFILEPVVGPGEVATQDLRSYASIQDNRLTRLEPGTDMAVTHRALPSAWMCSGPVPQHPPMICAPASRQRLAASV